MIRRALLAAALWLCAQPVLAATQIVVTSGTTWTAPADWSDSGATVELLGGGAQGGGAYAKKTGPGLSPGQVVTIQVGAGVDWNLTAGDTCFISCATVKAAGAIADQGGTVASSVGDTKFKGGNGANPALGVGTGGGGAAGLHGAGNNGSATNGGSADAGFGGAGGTAGATGGAGTEWGSVGSGGGGSGTFSCSGAATCMGGLYGGGGAIRSGGTGQGGLIVITYTPKQRTAAGVF